MGRKGAAGFSLLLTLGLLSLPAAGCRDRTPLGEFSDRFQSSAEERTRDLGIYLGMNRVGTLRFSRQEGEWEGAGPALRVSEKVSLRLSFRGDRFTVSSSQTSYVGENLTLLAGEGSMDFGAGSWETRYRKVGETLYEREQLNAGSRTRERIRVPEGVLVSDVLPLYMENYAGEAGTVTSLGVYNMALGQEFPLTLQYRGATPEGRLFTARFWGLEEKIWIDGTGMVVREEMALGVTARPPAEKEEPGYLPLETVLSMSAVPGISIPEDMGNRDQAVLVLEGSFRRPPAGRWQEVEGTADAAVVTLRKPVVPPPGERSPEADSMPRDTFGLDLDSARISELSGSITGDLSDPWEKALAIGKWVHEELGKSMRECFSALQVLEAGEGECQSHSLLMVSLCRAAGLPARFAYGVVYLPDRGVYGFHTWVEINLGDWIPMDPTLGNFPAGVDHLTLAVGGYQDQFRLFPYILGQGGWRIRIQDADRPSTGLGAGRTQDTVK